MKISDLINKHKENRLIRITAIIIWSVLICFLSLYKFKKDQIIENNLPFADKMVHFILYLGLGYFLMLNNEYSKKKISKYLLLVIGIGFGLIMELLQYKFFTYRSGDYKDLIFNMAGSISILLLYNRIKT